MSRPARPGFRPDIEGLRAVAVLAVVLFHAGVPGVGGGFVGVDVFFVISGFLITGLLWREVSTAGTVRLGRLRWSAGPPTAAGVGHGRRRYRDRLGCLVAAVAGPEHLNDGIACALYVGNYRFALQGIDYFAVRPVRRRSSTTGLWA